MRSGCNEDRRSGGAFAAFLFKHQPPGSGQFAAILGSLTFHSLLEVLKAEFLSANKWEKTDTGVKAKTGGYETRVLGTSSAPTTPGSPGLDVGPPARFPNLNTVKQKFRSRG